MIKIILDNIIFSLQKSGGISTVWYEFINKLLEDDNFDIYFLEYQGAENNILRSILCLPEEKILNIEKKESVFIERYKNIKIDSNIPFLFISSYYRICTNDNALNITIVHDFTYEYFRRGIAKFVHSVQKRNTLLKSELIICISENTKKDLKRFYPVIEEKKIEVVYNGVSNSYHKIEEKIDFTDLNPSLDFLNCKKVILFVGSRAQYKNFEIAVEVVANLENKYHLLVVGEPFSQSEIKKINGKLNEDRYTTLSRITNEELNLVYNLSFVLLYPSAYEGFGIPLLEAMRCRLPVIAYNNSSIPEVLEGTGLLMNNLDAQEIAKAVISLENVNFRNEIVTAGYKQSLKFSWEKTMTTYLRILKNLNYEK